MTMISTPIMPTMRCAPEPTADVPVIVRLTFWNNRSAPDVNVASSRSSAV